jgi:hypothetical protein
MAWTREQAIEMSRKGARKGGLARAARLSPERRYEIAVIGAVTKWHRASSELELIDRQLTKLAAIEAYAIKQGDMDRFERVVRGQIPLLKTRMCVRRLQEADDREAERRQEAEAAWKNAIIAQRDAEWRAWLKSKGLPTP